jgi:multicomponent Na+:H+ antiporter subunit A
MMSPLLFVLIAAFGAAIAAPVARFTGQAAGWLLALIPAFLFISLVQLLPEVADGGVVMQVIEWAPAYGVNLGFRLDGFSVLFSMLITGIGTLVVIYAGTYFSGKEAKDRGRFLAFIILFMTAMLGTVMADDLIVLFVFWEMTSLVSFFLIGFKHEDRAARDSALQSLVVTAGGGLALLGGILLLGSVAGTFSLSEITAQAGDIAQSPLFPAIVVLVLIGAFTKSAQFPFHFWLPNAMAAPTPASAYLHSATMVKLGVYLVARFDTGFGDEPIFYVPLIVFGGITMLIASVQAVRSTGFKAVLAYSTVASLATLIVLVGIPGSDAVKATIGFLVAHALYKAALFFAAGGVIHSTHVYELARLGGLRWKMPMTFIASVLAAISMAGLPLFLGYKAKDLLFTASFGADPLAWWATLCALVMSAAMTMVGLLAAFKPFWFKAPYGEVKLYHGESFGMALPPLVLGGLGLLFGVAPFLLWGPVMEPAIAALYGAPTAPVDAYVIPHVDARLLLTIGLLAAGLALVWLWTRMHRDPDSLRPRFMLADWCYNKVMGGVEIAAAKLARPLQTGTLRSYIGATVGVTVAGVAFALLGFEGAMIEAALIEPIRPYAVLILIFVLMGVAVAAFARSVLITIIGVGIVGYGMALLFLINGAPDVAFTQFTVETLFLVILVAVLLRIPLGSALHRPLKKRPRSAVAALGFGAATTLSILAMNALNFDPRLSEYFGEVSYAEAHGRNVVNVILVDFRALDTLGEIAVVAFATLAVWALLRRRTTDKEAGQ